MHLPRARRCPRPLRIRARLWFQVLDCNLALCIHCRRNVGVGGANEDKRRRDRAGHLRSAGRNGRFEDDRRAAGAEAASESQARLPGVRPPHRAAASHYCNFDVGQASGLELLGHPARHRHRRRETGDAAPYSIASGARRSFEKSIIRSRSLPDRRTRELGAGPSPGGRLTGGAVTPATSTTGLSRIAEKSAAAAASQTRRSPPDCAAPARHQRRNRGQPQHNSASQLTHEPIPFEKTAMIAQAIREESCR